VDLPCDREDPLQHTHVLVPDKGKDALAQDLLVVVAQLGAGVVKVHDAAVAERDPLDVALVAWAGHALLRRRLSPACLGSRGQGPDGGREA